MGIEETRQIYRDMMKYTDERLTLKFEEMVLKLSQNIGQLLLRKLALEEQLAAVKEAISENRGAATLMKEIQDYQVELVEARERERQIKELKKDEDSSEEVG